MAPQPLVRRLEWRFRPVDVLLRWPTDRPLACLVSGGDSARARWSICASPTRVVRGGENALDPVSDLAAAIGRAPSRCGSDRPPFVGGWIGWLSYDLGRCIEPSAQADQCANPKARRERAWPNYELFRCDSAYVHDAETNEWSIVGEADSLPTLRETSISEPHIGGFASRTGRGPYQRSIARTIESIRAGDIFQANIAHRLSAPFRGSTRAIAHRLLSAAGAWYGAYIESPDGAGGIRHAVCSASPELFLEFEARTRRIVTRPIKGTAAATSTAAAELAASAKDAAELTMIVDLMRNDLGRVCEYGSVAVEHAREIESHARAAILHGVATVSGTLRKGMGVADLLRATFPPGSVTGAPKIRAMQIIDALEPVRRGPYCGCVGYASDSGDSAWNVAIRTAAITCQPGSTAEHARGVIDYSVGAGIVAESDPAREWEETMHKAGILRKAFPESFAPTEPRP